MYILGYRGRILLSIIYKKKCVLPCIVGYSKYEIVLMRKTGCKFLTLSCEDEHGMNEFSNLHADYSLHTLKIRSGRIATYS